MHIKYQDLHLFPHKIQLLQLQMDVNKPERRAYGQTISQRIEDHPDLLDFIFSVTHPLWISICGDT